MMIAQFLDLGGCSIPSTVIAEVPIIGGPFLRPKRAFPGGLNIYGMLSSRMS